MAEGLRVLIVDDSRVVTTQLEGILVGVSGVEVVGTAADGAEAVRKAAAEEPDLVLMDIVMPEMDGLTALRIIRAARPQIRVAMVSSLAGRPREAEEALRLGAVRLVQKPFDASLIEALLESEIEEKRTAG